MAWNILYGDPGRKEMFRVIETFSGIGSQAKALTRIGKPFEIVNTADWDINAILAYCLIHKGKIDINKYHFFNITNDIAKTKDIFQNLSIIRTIPAIFPAD